MNTSAAGTPGAFSVRRGRRRGRNSLAALPDPREQDRLEAEADAHARALVAEAAASGEPLLDVNGNPRSHVTLPAYRLGRAPGNKGRRYPAEALAVDEALAILEQFPNGKSKTGSRNRALFIVLWRAGLRIAEALALEPRDIDLARGLITVRAGKGDKRRVVAIDSMTRRSLAELLSRREKLGLDSPELRARLGLADEEQVPVFCTLSGPGLGLPMHSSVARETLKLYARKAGIKKRVHLHGLRHTFASELSLEGKPLVVIQESLGHADPVMTAHYLRDLTPTDLIEWIGSRACPDDPAPGAAPSTSIALSAGEPVPHAPVPAPRATQQPRGAAYLGVQRRKRLEDAILEQLACDEARSTAQLAAACEIGRQNALRILHCLHEEDRIACVGMDPWNGGKLWKRTRGAATRFTVGNPRARTPNGEPLPRMLDAIAAFGGRASQAQLGRLLELAPSTVQGYCRELEAQGAIQRAGLDKTTSRRGSQVWRLPQPRKASFSAAGGYTLTLRVPKP